MSTRNLSPETASRIKQWATRTGKPENDLVAKYWQLYDQAIAKSPKMDPKKLEERSRATLYAMMRAELVTRAQPATGILVAADAPRNIGEIMRRQILRMEKEKALAIGALSPEGVPLDTRKEFGGRPNPNYSKPIQDNWLRNCYGVFSPTIDGKALPPKLTRVTLSRDIARAPVILGEPIKTRLNFQDPDANAPAYRANGSTATRWEKAAESIDVYNVIDQYFGTVFTSLSDLQAWHEAHKADAQRFVVTEGNVAVLNRAPMRKPQGREADPDLYFMMISDEAETFEAMVGTSCFCPDHLLPFLNFGIGSRVTVMGRTRMVPGFDPATRTPLPDQPRVAIDSWGVYCRPEFRVEAEGVSVS